VSALPRAVMLDTNLLLVLFVGSRDHERIGKAKGTQEYVPSDYELLRGIVLRALPLIVTPHLLTEVDNLLGRLHQNEREDCRHRLRGWLSGDARPAETQRPAMRVVPDPLYIRLGLADAALACAASSRRCVVWTNDHQLFLGLLQRNVLVHYWTDVRERLRDG
jgi:rRNA-processing protein FCF1